MTQYRYVRVPILAVRTSRPDDMWVISGTGRRASHVATTEEFHTLGGVRFTVLDVAARDVPVVLVGGSDHEDASVWVGEERACGDEWPGHGWRRGCGHAGSVDRSGYRRSGHDVEPAGQVDENRRGLAALLS